MAFVCDKIMQKGFDPRMTFSELYTNTKKRLVVTGTNADEMYVEYFCYVNRPDMRVIDAVRISISIPWRFTSPLMEGCRWIDGGTMDNFPLWKSIELLPDDQSQCIGINLKGSTCKKSSNLLMFSHNVVKCCLGERPTAPLHPQSHVIDIKVDFVELTDFNIRNVMKKRLFDHGYNIASQMLDNGTTYETDLRS